MGRMADATKAVAETGGKAIDLVSGVARLFKGPTEALIGCVEDKLKYVRWERQRAFIEKGDAHMRAKGLSAPSRALPLPFSVPLLTAAVLEEDDNLQDVWARLLVNAGDASTEMELRTAYVEILRGMSAFDVRNLAVMAKSSLDFRGKVPIPILETWNLPNSATALDEAAGAGEPLSESVEMSINNLDRLGCIAFASSTFGGRPIFAFATVTSLGMALYRACS